MPTISISTGAQCQMVDITGRIMAVIPPDFSGACLIVSQHTTAGITVSENSDPDVGRDMLMQFDEMVPARNPRYLHEEGNSAAHVKTALTGVSVFLPVAQGRLVLGTWQSVFLCEFDGPRQRRVYIQLIKEAGA